VESKELSNPGRVFSSIFYYWNLAVKFLLSRNVPTAEHQIRQTMYWTLELASYLEDAPWPATKDELIDFAMRAGAPLEVVENLQQIEDDEEVFDTIEDIWPDYPTKEDFFFNEDEY
jgi:hypothetical protein